MLPVASLTNLLRLQHLKNGMAEHDVPLCTHFTTFMVLEMSSDQPSHWVVSYSQVPKPVMPGAKSPRREDPEILRRITRFGSGESGRPCRTHRDV